MTGHFPVVLDACVLVQAAVRDTLLRLAENGLYLPRWSEHIIEEVTHTLASEKFNLQQDKIARLLNKLRNHFGDAWVEGYESLIDGMTNHKGDRHVLAAAVRCSAEVITTFNLKHFSEEALQPWNIEVRSPDDFLIDLFYLNPTLVIHTLHEQAAEIHRSINQLLGGSLMKPAPKFVHLIAAHISLQGSYSTA